MMLTEEVLEYSENKELTPAVAYPDSTRTEQKYVAFLFTYDWLSVLYFR